MEKISLVIHPEIFGYIPFTCNNENVVLTIYINFETVAEWQEFFDLPFVTSSLLVTAEDGQWVDYTGNGILVPKGDIDTYITNLDKEGGTKLGIMGTSLSVERIYTDEDESEQIDWCGSMNIFAALSEESASEASHTVILNDAKGGEILMEYTTPSGIPCVISKTTSEKYDESSFLYLFMVMNLCIISFKWISILLNKKRLFLKICKKSPKPCRSCILKNKYKRTVWLHRPFSMVENHIR